jgi:hypothetical protein
MTVRVDFAFVCDYAEVAGKINAMGIGFDTIYAPNLPTKHRLFFLVAQLRTSTVEAGEKKLEVDLIDDNGRDVVPPIRGTLNIPRPRDGTESVTRVAMEFGNVEFTKYGTYSLRLAVDGIELVDVPFKVSPPPATPPPPPSI